MRNFRHLIFALCLIGALSYSKGTTPPIQEDNAIEANLKRFNDTLIYWNDILMENNRELHSALESRMGYENHMKHILGLPLNDSMDYYDKLRVKIETTDLVGSNSIPQAHKGIHASKR